MNLPSQEFWQHVVIPVWLNRENLCSKKMVKHYMVRPSIEHYSNMVDLLGRAGILLTEAEELIAAIPMKPNAATWGALSTAYRIYRDYDTGMLTGNILITLDPNDSG